MSPELLTALIGAASGISGGVLGAWVGAKLTRNATVELERDRATRAGRGTRLLVHWELDSNFEAVAHLAGQLEQLPMTPPHEHDDGSRSGPSFSPVTLHAAVQALEIPVVQREAFKANLRELPNAVDLDSLQGILSAYDGAEVLLGRARHLINQVPSSMPEVMRMSMEHAAELEKPAQLGRVAIKLLDLLDDCHVLLDAGNPLKEIEEEIARIP